eukprot:TRINITY_DN3440_c0_g1_i1.p1 TRINITY_DN3440_c0_g1~~TRINITY_DN3440_c0_g1_i1.p1  ORF type:complete len:524 (+),score=126.78 TRINITY_DN3440_c0_g1_i1:44-1573(+)
MDLLLGAYGSDGEDDSTAPTVVTLKSKFNLSLAPTIVTDFKIPKVIDHHKREIFTNPTAEDLWKPIQGATAPWMTNSLMPGQNNTLTGFVEDANFNDYCFDREFYEFSKTGVATDPSNNTNFVVRKEKKRKRPSSPAAEEGTEGPQPVTKPEKPKKSEQIEEEEESDDAVDIDANTSDTVVVIDTKPNTHIPDVEELENMRNPHRHHNNQQSKKGAEPDAKKQKLEDFEPSATLHIDAEAAAPDYQGRTWVDPPSHLKPDDHQCYLPKRRIHTWAGHTKGVSAIRFFPKYGHLLLSASMDNTVKIWEVYGKRRCLQTYNAHRQAVRDIDFTKDGKQFVSASYDRYTRLFDTETGQCRGSFTTKKVPYCVKFFPADQHVFLVGQQDKKVIQWDSRTGKICQEYDRHLGAINTITFIDENRRFVTTSDDKSIRVWEYNIGVEIKYIAEPHMHSIPAASLSHDSKWLICQSLDNKILIYSTKDKFRINRKKTFAGHLTAGYACHVVDSPDGR